MFFKSSINCGNWYHYSWKGDISKSGGIATNIGIHFFDMLIWIFGDVLDNNVKFHNQNSAAGVLKLERANIKWHLSIDENDLPEEIKASGQRTFRSILIDDELFEFSKGFTESAHGLLSKSFRRRRIRLAGIEKSD